MTNTRFSFSVPMDDRLPFDTSPVVLSICTRHSTGTDDELIPKLRFSDFTQNGNFLILILIILVNSMIMLQ